MPIKALPTHKFWTNNSWASLNQVDLSELQPSTTRWTSIMESNHPATTWATGKPCRVRPPTQENLIREDKEVWVQAKTITVSGPAPPRSDPQAQTLKAWPSKAATTSTVRLRIHLASLSNTTTYWLAIRIMDLMVRWLRNKEVTPRNQVQHQQRTE